MRTEAALREATQALTAAGVDAARMNAVWLACHASGLRPAELYLLDELPAAAEARFHDLVGRRARREPLQHILGTAPFRNVELAVGPGVFVPRPETELLVDAVLPPLAQLAAPLVVDLCSGSGALAVAIAAEVPAAHVHAVELSAGALPWLRRNTAGTGVEVVEADVRDPGLLVALHGEVDAVVCNPPYVPSATDVDPEVRADPAEAVFGGTDGLALMAAVIARAADLLRSGGALAIEHDDTHGESVPALLVADRRWAGVSGHLDLAGRPRYVTARRA